NLAINKKFKTKNIYKINGVGVDPNIFNVQTKEKLDGIFNILVIGELNENKNQITILKAINKLRSYNLNIRVSMAGNGPCYDKLNKYILKKGLNKYVKLLGYRNDIPILLRETDLLISASKREGLPLNLIEAIMSGVPVL